MDTPILDFEKVYKAKDGQAILHPISFQVPENSVFVIFGRSGAGKTTLLRLVNRLEELTSGEIRYRGHSIHDQDPLRLRRKIGMIFQEPRLFPGTIRENLAFAPEYHGIPVDTDDLADSVGLRGMLQRDVSSLSHGEQQRVAIARAMATDPEVLLMDEPTSALDDAACCSIEALILRIRQQRSLTILFVSHNREQVARFGEEGIVLRGGKIIFRRSIRSYFARGHD